MRAIRKPMVVAGLVAGALVLSALPSEAQRRAVVRRPVRQSVVVYAGIYGSPFYRPFYRPFYSPFYWGAAYSPFYWGPGWYGPPYGYYGQWYPVNRDRVAIQLQVKPREAQVYVDGYYAGVVDDFDGRLQRLRVRAGEHEITIFLEGYRTVRETLRLSPGQDIRIERQLQPLGAGETSERPPAPAPEARDDPRGNEYPQPGDPRRPPARPAPPDRPGRPYDPPPSNESPGARPAEGFGTLAIRVQPAGAEIRIDGESWQGPEGFDRISVQLAPGTHRIEVSKDGFVTYSSEVQVREGETTPLNVSLPKKQ